MPTTIISWTWGHSPNIEALHMLSLLEIEAHFVMLPLSSVDMVSWVSLCNQYTIFLKMFSTCKYCIACCKITKKMEITW
jgi:hypothetical protein